MRPLFAAIAGGSFALAALIGGFTYHGLVFTSVFAPQYENVRRKTFEQSKSFRTGAIQELQNMQFEYIKASPEHKAALAGIIRHRAAEVPADAMPIELQSFVSNLPN